MKTNNIINNEIKSLIDLGSTILRKASGAHSSFEGNDLAEVSSWVTRLGQLLINLYGENSQHYKNFNKATSIESFYIIHRIFGVRPRISLTQWGGGSE